MLLNDIVMLQLYIKEEKELIENNEIITTIHGDNEMELRLEEAIKIRNLQPELNSKEELNKLIDSIM